MESIPEPIRGKLVAAGYDSFDKLPNNENVDRWIGTAGQRIGIHLPSVACTWPFLLPLGVSEGGISFAGLLPGFVTFSAVDTRRRKWSIKIDLEYRASSPYITMTASFASSTF
jgi:hypothetical protein